jgi:uncharacterized phiE125 gp8 family phage protein
MEPRRSTTRNTVGLTLVTPPTVEPVSLAEAKAHLRLDDSSDDGLLAGYILAARRFAEGYIRGAIITQTWDAKYDHGWPMVWVRDYCKTRIELPLRPVQSVSSVSYVDDNGATQTLSANLYTTHLDRPVPSIDRAYNADWPAVRDVSDAVTVRFVAGYLPEKVPDEIRTAILLHVESLYDSCEPEQKERCESCRNALLDPYKVLRFA